MILPEDGNARCEGGCADLWFRLADAKKWRRRKQAKAGFFINLTYKLTFWRNAGIIRRVGDNFEDESRQLYLIAKGQYRSILLFGDYDSFVKWIVKGNRPMPKVLQSTISGLAEQPDLQLFSAWNVFKPLSGNAHGLWEIRKDQARLLCCLRGRDIVILHWFAKKKNEIDERDINKALRILKEVPANED